MSFPGAVYYGAQQQASGHSQPPPNQAPPYGMYGGAPPPNGGYPAPPQPPHGFQPPHGYPAPGGYPYQPPPPPPAYAAPGAPYPPPNAPYAAAAAAPGPQGFPTSYATPYAPSAAPPGNFQVSLCTGRRRALLIGINYFGQRGELKGCINDVRNIKQFLIQCHNFREGDMVVLTDDAPNPRHQPTRENIIAAMFWLVNNSAVNDSYFFHYSGHGGQTKDLDGDEDDGVDETILPVDFQRAGHITDDEMHAIMVKPLPPGVRLTAIFDSCHSGTALDLPYVYQSDGQLVKNKVTKNVASSAASAGLMYLTGRKMGAFKALTSGFKMATVGNKATQITQQTRTAMADVIMFSGCKDSQTSADTSVNGMGATGAMSYAFIQATRENPRMTYLQLLVRMREILKGKYSQKPQLSTGRPIDVASQMFYM